MWKLCSSDIRFLELKPSNQILSLGSHLCKASKTSNLLTAPLKHILGLLGLISSSSTFGSPEKSYNIWRSKAINNCNIFVQHVVDCCRTNRDFEDISVQWLLGTTAAAEGQCRRPSPNTMCRLFGCSPLSESQDMDQFTWNQAHPTQNFGSQSTGVRAHRQLATSSMVWTRRGVGFVSRRHPFTTVLVDDHVDIGSARWVFTY